MNSVSRFCIWLVIFGLFTSHLDAGGSGLNVAIIVNQDSTNSIQLGNYYRERRNIPPQNVFRINWSGGNVNWSLSNYNAVLLNPFLSALASRQLTNQIDYIVLSMDIPYRIDGDNTGYNENSTTSALFYGFKSDDSPPCHKADGSTNNYAYTEGIFRQTPPISANSNSWLVTMITQSSLVLAEQIVDQGILGDSSFPTNTTWLDKSDDPDRNVRYAEFDNAIFDTLLDGNYSIMRTNMVIEVTNFYIGLIDFPATALGYQGGSYNYQIVNDPLLVPGGFADNLDSFSGEIFENPGETSILPFLTTGASGSYGTVIEPCAYLEKFPDSLAYFYQSRGFSLAECYYLSLLCPYQGLTVGEPLSAPFVKPATGSWSGLVSNAVLSAMTNLSVQFNASDALHPIQQLDIFVDGSWFETVTNLAPQQNNVLNVSIAGHATSYTVPANATIGTVTSNLVSTLNTPVYTNQTKVIAFLDGDRIELDSGTPYTTRGSNIALSAYSTNTSGTLTTFIRPTGTDFLDSVAEGIIGYEIAGTVQANSTLTASVTKTNGNLVTVDITNNGIIAQTNMAGLLITQQFINLINTAALTRGLTASPQPICKRTVPATRISIW